MAGLYPLATSTVSENIFMQIFNTCYVSSDPKIVFGNSVFNGLVLNTYSTCFQEQVAGIK